MVEMEVVARGSGGARGTARKVGPPSPPLLLTTAAIVSSPKKNPPHPFYDTLRFSWSLIVHTS